MLKTCRSTFILIGGMSVSDVLTDHLIALSHFKLFALFKRNIGLLKLEKKCQTCLAMHEYNCKLRYLNRNTKSYIKDSCQELEMHKVYIQINKNIFNKYQYPGIDY